MNTAFRSASEVDRTDEYVEIGSSAVLPITTGVISRCATRAEVDDDILREALLEHQTDVQSEGTVYRFVKRMVNDGTGNCLYYTDWAMYFAVDDSVWADERGWFDFDEKTFNAVKMAHTVEVDRVTAALDIDTRSRDAGYVLFTPFPLRSVTLSDQIEEDVFTVAERAEFLERDTGLNRQDAVLYALFEQCRKQAETPDAAIETVSEILDMDEQAVEGVIGDVSEWGLEVSAVLQELDESVEGDSLPAGDIFGTVAAIQSSDDDEE